MKNEEFIKQFVDFDTEEKTENQNVIIKGNVLFSYGFHFPICLKLENGYYLVNKDKYSVTTSRHQGILKRNLSEDKIVYTDTLGINKAILGNIKNVQELILEGLAEYDK